MAGYDTATHIGHEEVGALLVMMTLLVKPCEE
jgi:hypothetical protein